MQSIVLSQSIRVASQNQIDDDEQQNKIMKTPTANTTKRAKPNITYGDYRKEPFNFFSATTANRKRCLKKRTNAYGAKQRSRRNEYW